MVSSECSLSPNWRYRLIRNNLEEILDESHDFAIIEMGMLVREVVIPNPRHDLDAGRLREGLDDRQQGLRSGIRDDRRIDLATPLQEPEYGHFTARATTSFPLADTAEITLVGFDLATGKRIWRHDLLATVWGSPLVADGK